MSDHTENRRLAKTLQLERYYDPDRDPASAGPDGGDLLWDQQAMCELLAAISLRLIRQRASARLGLRVVK